MASMDQTKVKELTEPNNSCSIISTLPEEDAGYLNLCNYAGFWVPKLVLPRLLHLQHQFAARPDDVLIASYPKSGTTWLKALVFAITSRSEYAIGGVDHPLFGRNPHECVPFLEVQYGEEPQHLDLESLPSPRLLASHVPFSLLPSSLKESDCKIVYVCREPKDVFVSMWHFADKNWSMYGPKTTFDDTFVQYARGVSMFGPAWDHNLEYWRESLRRPEKVLLLKYEAMMKDPKMIVRRLAEFVGFPFSEEEEKRGLVDDLLRMCSFENLKGLEVNNEKVMNRLGGFPIHQSSFFRKGVVGGWGSHLSEEMAHTLDHVTEEKLHGSGLTFG